MSNSNVVYETYSAVLGRLRDDDVLSNEEIEILKNDYLQTGTFKGINENLSEFKTNKVWEFLNQNFQEFLKKHGFNI